MTDIDIPDDPRRTPPDVVFPLLPPDFLAPGLEPSGFEPAGFEPPPEHDTMPEVRLLSPHVQRQMLLGKFLDDAEVVDRQLAIAAAARARSVDELRQVSVAIALEEEAEDATRPPDLRVNRDQEAGWSIHNRAKTELATELAVAYNLSKSAALTLVEESATLVADLPLTLDALSCGSIRYEHAKVIVTACWGLPAEARAAFEALVLPWAKTMIVSAFRAKVQKAREEKHPTSMQQRHEKAAQFRGVTCELGEDGVGFLTLRDSNETVAAIRNRLTDLATPTFAGDPRSLSQRRVDIGTELLLKGDLCAWVDETEADGTFDGSGLAPDGKRLGHGIVARVHIEVPVLTLLGLDTAPATLEGTVPIDPATARKLVADAPGFYRLLTDPITGSVVSFDDKFRYLPASLRRAVQLVDGTCTAPWCDTAAHDTDGHHPDEWAESHDTSLANSALLCKPDHRLVHNTRWTMVKLAGGDKQWISPCGRIRRVAPLRRLHPAFVEAMKPEKNDEKAAAQSKWDVPDNPEEVMPF